MLVVSDPLYLPLSFSLSDDPNQFVMIEFEGGDKARFKRTPFAAVSQFCSLPEEYIIAHFREDVPSFARHLLVFDDETMGVLFVDEFNPDLGHVSSYQQYDVEDSEDELWESDGLHAYAKSSDEEDALPPEVSDLSRVGEVKAELNNGEGLAWGKKAPSREFLEKVIAIAEDVETNPSWLLTQFYGESRFLPQAHLQSNGQSMTDRKSIGSKTIGGGLFGLMKRWAKPALGVDFFDFMAMTDLEQLDVAHKFYKKAAGSLNSMNDVFTYTFWPAALKKKDSFVLMRKGDGVYEQNRQMDVRKAGEITKADAASLRFKLMQDGLRSENRLDAWSDFPEPVKGVMVQHAPAYTPDSRNTVVRKRGHWVMDSDIGGFSNDDVSRHLRNLAHTQIELTLQAIISFVLGSMKVDYHENLLLPEDMELFEELSGFAMKEAPLQALKRTEAAKRLKVMDEKKRYLEELEDIQDKLEARLNRKDIPTSDAVELQAMALDELISAQSESTSSDIELVAYTLEEVKDLLDGWKSELYDIFEIE